MQMQSAGSRDVPAIGEAGQATTDRCGARCVVLWTPSSCWPIAWRSQVLPCGGYRLHSKSESDVFRGWTHVLWMHWPSPCLLQGRACCSECCSWLQQGVTLRMDTTLRQSSRKEWPRCDLTLLLQERAR